LHRFFVPRSLAGVSELTLAGDLAQQISRVLRLRQGEQVVLLDGTGYEYPLRLDEIGKDTVSGTLLGRTPGRGEPAINVDLYLSLLNKPDKYEWALQKCTELGASRFVPMQTSRSVSEPPQQGRRERWERIIQEAAEQSGRSRLPLLDESLPLKAAVKAEGERCDTDGEQKHLALMPAPGADLSIADALRDEDGFASVSIFIGPEGGFTDDELEHADRRGIRLVSMGPRTLRAESAAVAALAVVMYELGEMGEYSNVNHDRAW
jgi:16S rRNA (uracil1498-N3)-methyltransferase